MSPQEAGDGLESILQLQVQIKGHNQREYEDKWQGWQNRNDEKLATKLTTDDQQQIWLLPARWWPDTLQELECGGWLQRPHKRVRCRQCKCSVVENPSFKSSKCQLVLLYRLISGTSMIFIRKNKNRFVRDWIETKHAKNHDTLRNLKLRQSFEIWEICGFWREISNITHTA